ALLKELATYLKRQKTELRVFWACCKHLDWRCRNL
ncbi:hypothetical protein NPIL_428982, partial [Nephila pilipes]